MSTTITVTCDRCGVIVPDRVDREVSIRVETTQTTAGRYVAWDLCPPCVDIAEDFLRKAMPSPSTDTSNGPWGDLKAEPSITKVSL